jgi:histidyl-tRNA synthetase
VLGEFFAAREDEIDKTLVEEGPFERFETVEAKTVSSVSIATLGEILGAGGYDDLFERADEEARQAAGGEAGIDAVLPEIQRALAAASDIDAIAARWAATDELADWEPGEVREVVQLLARLARQAEDQGRLLWFWWSL